MEGCVAMIAVIAGVESEGWPWAADSDDGMRTGTVDSIAVMMQRCGSEDRNGLSLIVSQAILL